MSAVFLGQVLFLLVTLVFTLLHLWKQTGPPIKPVFSHAVIIMLFISLGITLSWSYFGLPVTG